MLATCSSPLIGTQRRVILGARAASTPIPQISAELANVSPVRVGVVYFPPKSVEGKPRVHEGVVWLDGNPPSQLAPCVRGWHLWDQLVPRLSLVFPVRMWVCPVWDNFVPERLVSPVRVFAPMS